MFDAFHSNTSEFIGIHIPLKRWPKERVKTQNQATSGILVEPQLQPKKTKQNRAEQNRTKKEKKTNKKQNK